MNPIPLTAPDGSLVAYACGRCRLVPIIGEPAAGFWSTCPAATAYARHHDQILETPPEQTEPHGVYR